MAEELITASESTPRTVDLEIIESSEPARIVLSGGLDVTTSAQVWEKLSALVTNTKARSIIVNASGITYLDGFGAGLLVDLRRRALPRKIELVIEGLRPNFEAMLAPFEVERYVTLPAADKREPYFVESIGEAARGLLDDLRLFAEFTGDISKALVYAAFHPHQVRWKDVHRTAVAAGADAIPVVMLVGFLIGFVMAFQSAIPLSQFGADAFIPTLVGIAMLRELGPIMTALGLAGRSGAAFAAEIGTMKVNEEVSALITLGLTPIQFLIVPRVIAAVAMTPFLIVFANVAGLLGGLVVFVAIGFPPTVYFDQIHDAIKLKDLLGGLFKGFAFGFVVAAVGCMRGLQTTTGASAVGRSTTSAVVTSIVLVAIGDGLFAIVYYFLGI